MVKDISCSARIIVDTDNNITVSWPRQLLCVRHSIVRSTSLCTYDIVVAASDHSCCERPQRLAFVGFDNAARLAASET